MTIQLKEVDKIEILTLQDNYIDIAAMDSNEVVQRALPVKDLELKNSVLAEHGFSAVVTVTAGTDSRSILFDFGFSEHGAAFNADALGIDLKSVEALVLSHGHMDHFGGLESLLDRVGQRKIELLLHPNVFRGPRYIKITEELKIGLPKLNRERLTAADIQVVESAGPKTLVDDMLLFLGEVPHKTEFEKGFPRMFFEDNGEEKWDPIEDDTAIVANVKNKGLVILSGCAHAGIVNTVNYAREVTGVDPIFAVMGGFHLTGVDFEPVIEPTKDALKQFNPQYIIPTHCTGRKATMRIEQEMPEQFLLNMSGTKMTFSS